MCVMPYTTTKQDIEVQFGTNHIGHFLWTNLLLERVLAAGPHARIVNVASTGYTLSDVRLEDWNFDASFSNCTCVRFQIRRNADRGFRRVKLTIHGWRMALRRRPIFCSTPTLLLISRTRGLRALLCNLVVSAQLKAIPFCSRSFRHFAPTTYAYQNFPVPQTPLYITPKQMKAQPRSPKLEEYFRRSTEAGHSPQGTWLETLRRLSRLVRHCWLPH